VWGACGMASSTGGGQPLTPQSFLEKGLRGVALMRENGLPEAACEERAQTIMRKWDVMMEACSGSGGVSVNPSVSTFLSGHAATGSVPRGTTPSKGRVTTTASEGEPDDSEDVDHGSNAKKAKTSKKDRLTLGQEGFTFTDESAAAVEAHVVIKKLYTVIFHVPDGAGDTTESDVAVIKNDAVEGGVWSHVRRNELSVTLRCMCGRHKCEHTLVSPPPHPHPQPHPTSSSHLLYRNPTHPAPHRSSLLGEGRQRCAHNEQPQQVQGAHGRAPRESVAPQDARVGAVRCEGVRVSSQEARRRDRHASTRS
jgi:hypothetical protein